MIINTGKELADKFSVGDNFYVENGQWIGHVKEKKEKGVVIDAHNSDGTILKKDVLWVNDANVSLIVKDNKNFESDELDDLDER